MGNNDNRVVTQRALNSFITSNGGTVVASDSDVALVYEQITSSSYAPQYQSNNGVVTSAGIRVSDYTGIGGGAYTAKQVVIEKDVTWESVSRVPTTGISISGPTQVNVGGTITLTATLTPSNATDPVVWSIDDTSKATIDQNGVVTGVAEGTVTVTATSNGISATHQVEVTRTYNPSGTANVNIVGFYATAAFPNTNPVANPSAQYVLLGSADDANNPGGTIQNFFTYTTGSTKTFYISPYYSRAFSHVIARCSSVLYNGDPGSESLIQDFSPDVHVEYIGTWQQRPVYAATFAVTPRFDGDYVINLEVYVNSRWLDVDDIEIAVGETQSVSYYPSWEGDTVQSIGQVQYYIEDTSIATVDSSGVVTGVSEGTTSIQVVGRDSFGKATVTVTAGSGPGGNGGESSATFNNSINSSPITTFDVFGVYDYDTATDDSYEYTRLSNGEYDSTASFDTSEGSATAFLKTNASFTISCSSAEEANEISVSTYEYNYSGDWGTTNSSSWLSASTEVDGASVTISYSGLSDNVGGNDLWAYLVVTAGDNSWEAYVVRQTNTYGPGSRVGHGGSGRQFAVDAYPTYAWNASWSDSDKIDSERNYGGNANVIYSEDVSHPSVTFSSNMGKSDTTYTF